MAVAMAAVYPHLVWPEVAAAYAAVSLGRCDWADRHFNRIGRMTRHPAALVSALRLIADGESSIPATLATELAHRADQPRLTRREHDMLSGLRAGLSNKEIADKLQLSEVTVKHHVKSLGGKLGARNPVSSGRQLPLVGQPSRCASGSGDYLPGLTPLTDRSGLMYRQGQHSHWRQSCAECGA